MVDEGTSCGSIRPLIPYVVRERVFLKINIPTTLTMIQQVSDQSVTPTKTPTIERGRRTPPVGMEVERVFSTKGQCPFDELTWEKRTVEITDENGESVFHQAGVEVPVNWSALATKIAVSKYLYGDLEKGTDPTQGGRETSIRQMIHRVTRSIADCGFRDGYFADFESAEAFCDELSWLCLNQYGAFNSPVWFNVGLHEEYGIGEGRGRGNYAINRETGQVERCPSQYVRPQASACFIQSVEDDMEDIMRLAKSEAMLFKYGSGSGSDLSTLRSTREKLSGGGRPSGPLSFLKVYDQIANVVKSGGKTRRAAKMNTLKDWHPDIAEFIDAKQKEEKKAWALIEQGYDGNYNGEAYGSVMFQNENLSVRASDEFMEAAVADKEWWTRRVTDDEPCEKLEARTLLRKIAEGTHICGDPGMQFDSTIHRWHTCKGTARQNSTNPCSEYLFLDNTACNLASLNLLKFRQADGGFDVARYRAAIRLFITAQEILVDHASYPTPEICENSHRFRSLGLGYANLGALIMSHGLSYHSDEGRALCGALTGILTGEAYTQSARMAARRGAFPGYHDSRACGVKQTVAPDNVDSMQKVMQQHRAAVREMPTDHQFASLVEEARAAWDRAIEEGDRHGYRNAQVTVLAPTGTISFLMDCDTTGIEPDIALVKYKLLAGGGMLKIVNQTVKRALEKLGYGIDEQEKIIDHIDVYDTVEDVCDEQSGEVIASGLRPAHLAVFDCAFAPQKGERSLSAQAHLGMMAAAQPFLSGAISKTVNLPESATVEEIMETYIAAWRMGLKAVAIYREGSKRSAPLNTSKITARGEIEGREEERVRFARQIADLEEELTVLRARAGEPVRHKMPDTRASVTHKFDIAGHEGYLTVGHFENEEPGEVFIQMAKEGSTIGGLMDTVATLTSMALQYGVPLESLVRKFAYQRFEPSGFTKNPDIRNATSITDYVFRWLGCRYIAGYLEAISPLHNQPELPIEGIEAMERAALDRPVADLPRDDEMIPGAGRKSADGEKPALGRTHADRVKAALGTMYMDQPCSNCHSHKVIRAGACGVCTQCGTSQGCG